VGAKSVTFDEYITYFMKTILPVLLLLVLSSCEGFVHMQGYVYDSATKQPVKNSQVLLIMHRKDTLRVIYYEYDTVSYSKRKELRKAGVKDDYDYTATGGLSKKPAPALTDTNGKFTIGTILVPCVPKCPSCKLVVIKDGYKQREVPLSSIVNDSLFVSLERQADSVNWISINTDSGVVHAAEAIPEGKGPFPAIIILHGTHGFAQEYIKLTRSFAKQGFIGIAACWFAGRKGPGERFITPIEFNDAPPFVDVEGSARFRIARNTIDSLVQKVNKLTYVQKDQIALWGHSRGGGACLDYAFSHPGKVQAIMLNSTGYPNEIIKRAAEISIPVLLLHGTADSPQDGGSAVTNIKMARQFEAALRAANKDVEVKYYEGSGHNGMFTNSAQFDDVVQTVSDFLQKKIAKK
jgi:dienelactone hydrolase